MPLVESSTGRRYHRASNGKLPNAVRAALRDVHYTLSVDRNAPRHVNLDVVTARRAEGHLEVAIWGEGVELITAAGDVQVALDVHAQARTTQPAMVGW